MKYNTLAAILKGKWLMDPASARAYLPMVSNLISGKLDVEENKPSVILSVHSKIEAGRSFIVADNFDLRNKENLFSPGCAVIVPIQGALTRDNQMCGPVGMMNLSNIVKHLSQNENVDTLIFEINSPGGMVDGTQTLAEAIKDSPKRTIGYVNDGMACSAAYWISSSCDELYVSKKTDVVGSIGVYCTLADFKAYMESEGLPIHEIYSRRSSEKNKNYKDAMEGKYEAMQDDLDFIADEFIAAVNANRPGINLSKGDPFKGATYYAEQAMEIGLIDGIKSIDEIMASINSNQNQNSNSKIMSNEKKDATTIEVVTTADVITGIAESISAMSEDDVVSLNNAMTNHQLVDSGAELVTEAMLAELILLRDYKTTNEAWKNANNVNHTVTDAKPDKFETETKDGEYAEHNAYLNEIEQKYGI